MVTAGDRLAVITEDGGVFGAQLVGREMHEVLQFVPNDRIGYNPQDRFMVALGNTLVVITRDGNVFGADVIDGPFIGKIVGTVFQFSGAKIGFSPQDRFMMAMGHTLVVVTDSGDVFGADVDGRTIGPVFQFSGAKIGFSPQDRFMMAMGHTLVVVTDSGDVFGADVDGRTIGPVFQFSGAKIGFSPQDRFMVCRGNTLIVVTGDGDVFGADVLGRNIGPVYQMNHAPDTETLDTTVTSDLPLSGSAHVVVRKNGNFTFSCHAHDSGFWNIDYVLSAVLLTTEGIAFTFEHSGSVEGTEAGLPFGTPNRDDDFTRGGHDDRIGVEWGGMNGATLIGRLDGRSTIHDILNELSGKLIQAGEGAVISLVA